MIHITVVIVTIHRLVLYHVLLIVVDTSHAHVIVILLRLAVLIALERPLVVVIPMNTRDVVLFVVGNVVIPIQVLVLVIILMV